MKNQLYTRAYEGDNGKEVVVIGNRTDISDPVDNIMEAEFVFRNGELISLKRVVFNQTMDTYTCHYMDDDGVYDQWFEIEVDAPKHGWSSDQELYDHLQSRVRDLSGRLTAVLHGVEKYDQARDLPFEPLPSAHPITNFGIWESLADAIAALGAVEPND